MTALRRAFLWCGLLVLPIPTAALAQAAPATPGWQAIRVAPLDRRPPEDDANIEAGRHVYNFRCSACHGVLGEADGPVAPYLDPRPRNFLFANFKFRTTVFSELPLDEDLYRTITRGVPGTAMPSWQALPEEQRWQAVYYIKYLARDYYEDPEFDPRRTGDEGETYLIEVPPASATTPELIARGKEAFATGKCIECHGENGLGNGTSAGKQFTYLQERILPRNLTKGWRYKGGSQVEDIWRTLTAGLNGTPMPSFIGALDQENAAKDEADRWALAHYISSLIEHEPESAETMLQVVRVEGQAPTDPDDPAWEAAHEIRFRLLGQVTRRPRWQTPSVDHVRVRALYDDEAIAIRLEYHDRTESREHVDPDVTEEPTTYPELDVEDYEHNRVTFRDAVALQFPVKPQVGARRPYFVYGQMDNPVNLWRHLADREGADAFEVARAKGPEKIQPHVEDAQNLAGGAVYEDGVWRVVFRRALTTDSPKRDAQFAPGEYIPFVVMAWDGAAGETGLRQSISSWYTLHLDAPVSTRVYQASAAAVVLTLLAEVFLLWRARHRAAPGGSP